MRQSVKDSSAKKTSSTEDIPTVNQQQEVMFQKRSSLDQKPPKKLGEEPITVTQSLRKEAKTNITTPNSRSSQITKFSPRSLDKNSLQDVISIIDREKIKNLVLNQERDQKAPLPQNKAGPLSQNVHKISKSQVVKPKTAVPSNRGSDLQKHLQSPKTSSKLEGPSRLKTSPRDSQKISSARYVATEGNYQPKRNHLSSESLREKNLLPGSKINVYFYKNFNKFIQNLYIKEEQNHQNVRNNHTQSFKGTRDKYAAYKPDKFFKKNLQLPQKKHVSPADQPEYRQRVNTDPSTNQFAEFDFARDLAARRSKEFIRASPRSQLRSVENQAKNLGKSTSLKLFQLHGAKKALTSNNSPKQQFFSPRVGKY